MKKPAFFLLLVLIGLTAKARRFTLPAGQSYWIVEDFNKRYGLLPGDTVVLSGSYGDIDIFEMTGLVWVGYQAKAASINFREKVLDVQLLGDQVAGVSYGIEIGPNPQRFGLYHEATGNIVVRGVKITGCNQGWQLLTKKENEKKYRSAFQNVTAEQILIENSINEGLYHGHYKVDAPAFIRAKYRKVIVKNSGNDGMQLRNGSFDVQDCEIDGTGGNGDIWHGHGLLFGGNTKNGIAKNNRIRAGGFGIFCNGYGEFEFSGNVISSGNCGVFTKNYEAAAEDVQQVGFQKIIIRDNEIQSKNGYANQHYFKKEVNCPVTVVFENNRTAGKKDVQPGVRYAEKNNGPSVQISLPLKNKR